MGKQTYIVAANVDFLEEKNFTDTFVNGTEEEIIAFCEDNYDREDSDFAMYTYEDFLTIKHNDNGEFLYRKIEKFLRFE